jgi:VCBS repeat-containing protein
LTDALGNRLFEKTVVFVVSGSGGSHRETVITDYAGRASLGNLPLPPGDYTINAFFNGVIPLGNGNTVTLDDQRYNPASATGALTLTNAAPVAVNDSYTVNEDTTLTVAAPGVLGNDTDADNMSLTAILVSGPGHGTLNLNPNGSFSYTPAANFNGADTFTYKANDGIQDSNTATVTITIQPVNDAPVAVNDAYSVDQNNKLIIVAPGVLANDTDIDSVSLTAALVSGPSHGSLILKASGAFTYTPAYGFTGTDSFTYKANDGSLNSNVATVTITVKPKPLDCSTAQPDPAIIWQPNNKFKTIKVVGLGNPNANITIVSIFQDERVGKDKYSPDGKGIGTNTAQIRAERSGTGNGRVYHISFTATDGQGGSCSGKVRVAVPHDQDPPIDLDAIDGGPLYNSTVAQ